MMKMSIRKEKTGKTGKTEKAEKAEKAENDENMPKQALHKDFDFEVWKGMTYIIQRKAVEVLKGYGLNLDMESTKKLWEKAAKLEGVKVVAIMLCMNSLDIDVSGNETVETHYFNPKHNVPVQLRVFITHNNGTMTVYETPTRKPLFYYDGKKWHVLDYE